MASICLAVEVVETSFACHRPRRQILMAWYGMVCSQMLFVLCYLYCRAPEKRKNGTFFGFVAGSLLINSTGTDTVQYACLNKNNTNPPTPIIPSMMRASEPISPYSYEAPPPYVQDEAVPFQRVRNRKTMQEYDFLLNSTMDQLGNDGNDDSGW